jgi:outer membrane lipoprotein-sorting protein
MEEDQDAAAKYYVLSAYEDAGNDRLTPVRKFWIERADLVIARQQTYDGEGTLTGIIHYANFSPAEGLLLPLSIRIERPLDGYSLDMEFRNWRMNPKLPDDAFILTPPPGARRIQLIERAKSKDS